MIKDIYVRNPEDPNYKYGVLEHSDPIESITAKIRQILGTEQGQVLGDLKFGIGIEQYIFETKFPATQIEELIKSQIYTYISESRDYNIQPKVNFGTDGGIDYAVIDIFIDNTRQIGILVK